MVPPDSINRIISSIISISIISGGGVRAAYERVGE
jgi:hypothetical protein